MKPSWLDAPRWANHLAKTAEGEWYWFEFMPEIDVQKGIWDSSGRCELAGHANDDWRESWEVHP